MKTLFVLKQVHIFEYRSYFLADKEFFIEKYYPINGEENVVLDVTLSLEFSDSIPLSQGFQSFFFLLNQFTGVTTEIPASCVVVKNSYSLEIPVVSCLGDVLEANTAYVFYVAQRLNGNQIETLSSIKNVPINERAFNLLYKSIHFRTVDSMIFPFSKSSIRYCCGSCKREMSSCF